MTVCLETWKLLKGKPCSEVDNHYTQPWWKVRKTSQKQREIHAVLLLSTFKQLVWLC